MGRKYKSVFYWRSGHLSGVLYRCAFFQFSSLIKESACVIPVPDKKLCWDGILKRIIPNHKMYHRFICCGHKSIRKCILGRTAGGHAVQLDLEAGLASTVIGVLRSPFRTTLEISKEGDSPTSLGNVYLHIHCHSGIVHIFQDLCRYETIETSDVL